MSETNDVITIDLSKEAQPQPTQEEVDSNVVEETPTQPPQEEAKNETKEDPKFASRFAALSKKEKEIIQKEKALKESIAKAAEYEKALSSIKSDPLALVKAAGFSSLEEYLQTILNSPESTPVDPYKQKVDQIEQEIQQYKLAQEQAKAAYEEQVKQQQLSEINKQINDFITQEGDKYELIQAYDASSEVWNLIERVYIETKGETHLTIQQAADEIEKYYLEEAKKQAERVSKLKKLNLKVEPLQESSQPKETQHKLEQVSDEWNVSPTLTNTTSIPQPSAPMLSKEERLKRAAAKLKWNDE